MSTKAQFTPGPWKYQKGMVDHIHGPNKTGGRIIVCQEPTSLYSRRIWPVNAQLIQHSPDMYDLLERILKNRNPDVVFDTEIMVLLNKIDKV